MSGGSETREERIERLARRTALHAVACRDAETGGDGYWVPAYALRDLGETIGVELPEKPAEQEDTFARFGLMRGALDAQREVIGAVEVYESGPSAGCPECHRVGGHDRDCVNNQS